MCLRDARRASDTMSTLFLGMHKWTGKCVKMCHVTVEVIGQPQVSSLEVIQCVFGSGSLLCFEEESLTWTVTHQAD